MLRYVLKRLLLAIPTILLVSVAVFLAGNALTQTDEEAGGQQVAFSTSTQDPDEAAKAAAQKAHIAHKDIPAFYFSVTLNCYPDTFYRIYPIWRKDKLRKMALSHGHWPPVQVYEQALGQLIRTIERDLPDSLLKTAAVQAPISTLLTASHTDTILRYLQLLNPVAESVPSIDGLLDATVQKATALTPQSGWGYPVFHWYGSENQYHQWLTGKYAHETASPWWRLRFPLRVTLFIQGMAILLGVLLAIPLGLRLAQSPKWARMGKRTLMLLFVTPTLLVACLLRFGFATPSHGWFLRYIGGVGTGTYNPEVQHFGAWIVQNQGKLLLPILTIALHVMALVALQMRQSALGTAKQDFIRTAKAKGLSTRRIWWKHVLWNALTPILVIIGNILPALLGGSILIEHIFNINGMGNATITAIYDNNYDLLMTIVLLSTVLTVLGSLLTDILLAWTDPRVRMR